MKKFLEGVIAWKTAAAMMSSGAIILCTIIMFFSGETAVPISVLTSIFIVSALGTFLQFLAFTDRVIKKMRYSIRMTVFAIPFFAVLAANAYIFHWFPAYALNWILFAAIFVVIFAVMFAGFEIYYHIIGKKYDGLLGQYRKQKDLEK